MSWEAVVHGLFDFAFYYPLFMAYVWIAGALYYFFYREHVEQRRPSDPPALPGTPPVTFLVPCHNEAANVEETVRSLLGQDYPALEVVAIDDASRDRTAAILDGLADADERVRVIRLTSNRGKAAALRIGALASRNDYLICLDGDALLDPHATRWLMYHFLGAGRVGAVTGNPRVRNRTTLLGKIQVGEFSSIIGLIKRAQRIYGRIFTVSGVVAAFYKPALHRVGYWNTDMVTEDIDVSWRLQLDHWDIRYEPNALCWILMPETLQGLWRQRLRWAQGGVEVFMRYWRRLLAWRSRRMWMVALELGVSTSWAYTIALISAAWLVGLVVGLPAPFASATVLPGWSGVVLGITCLAQFAISLVLDARYERSLGRVYYWLIWYPMVYWVIHSAATIAAVPKAVLRQRREPAIWTSPDRGIGTGEGR